MATNVPSTDFFPNGFVDAKCMLIFIHSCVSLCEPVCVFLRDKEREIDQREVMLPCECWKDASIMQMSALNVVGHHPLPLNP